ncbi:MAG: DUF3238 domain-containing protein [Chitinophagales bacterium]|nr:DUF3238 domain-containing protein [Chitinophagales bacterium]
MMMSGRYWSSESGYRFGFNGTEQDDEISGTTNYASFEYRVYNSNLGRFLSVDPLAHFYPYSTPYAFAENDVVRAIDLEGLEKYKVTFRSFIPQAYIDNPSPLGESRSFRGDNRYYYDVYSKSFRTEQKVSVDFDRGNVDLLSNIASASIGLNRNGEVIETSEIDKAGIVKVSKGFDENSEAVSFYFNIDAKNKLVSFAPHINADMVITLVPQKDGSFNYSVSGTADGFPAYEIFVTDITDGAKLNYLIFNQNPIEAGKSPWALSGKGEMEYDYNANSKSEQTGSKKDAVISFENVENSPQKE